MPTTPYQTLGDIRSAIVQDSKEQSSAALVQQINRWVNEGYEQVVMRRKRDWLDSQQILQFASQVTAVCTVTYNSTLVTFETGTTFNEFAINNNSGTFIFYNSGYSENYYAVSATGNVIRLSNQYLGPTNTAANGYVVHAGLRISSGIRDIYQTYHQWMNHPVVNVGPQQYREIESSLGRNQDYAQYYTIFGQSSGGDKKILIYPYANQAYTLYADVNSYLTELTTDTSEPVIPMQYRQILYHFGMYKLFSYHRNEAKASESLTNFNTMLTKMDGEAKVDLDFPQIQVKYPRGRRSSFLPGFDRRLRD